MKHIASLTTSTFLLLQNIAIASDTPTQTTSYSPFQYVVHHDQIKSWTSKNEWLQSLQTYLSDEQIVQKYSQMKAEYTKNYQLEQEQEDVNQKSLEKFNENFYTASLVSTPFLGMFVSLFAGAASGSKGHEAAKGFALVGGVAGGIFGICYYFCTKPDASRIPNDPIQKISLEEKLIPSLKIDIENELRLKGYLTSNFYYPNNTDAEGTKEVDDFLRVIMQE